MIVKVDGKDWIVPEGYDTVMYEDEYVTHDGCLAIRSKAGGGIVTVDEAGVIHGLLEEDNVDRIERHCEKEYYARKDDKDKEPYYLIPEICVREMLRPRSEKCVWAQVFSTTIAELRGDIDSKDALLEVLKYGVEKYGKANSWKRVEDAQDRYAAAAHRHYRKRVHEKEIIDFDSKLPHIYHELCNYMFLMWFELQERKNAVTYGGVECHK
jgi:hypothetical protein